MIDLQSDIDQDGIIDPFKFMNGYIYVDYSSKAGGFVSTGIPFVPGTASFHPGDKVLAVQDINGDSWPDVVIYRYNAGNARVEVYPSSGNVNSLFSTAVVICNLSSAVVDHQVVVTEDAELVGDIDGNGLPDFLITYKGGNILSQLPMGQPRVFKLNNSGVNGLYFSDVQAPSVPLYVPNDALFSFFYYFIDINGDGLIDILGWNTGTLSVKMNMGGGNFADWSVVSSSSMLKVATLSIPTREGDDPISVNYPYYYEALKVSDVDGDGKPEILFPGDIVVSSCNGSTPTNPCGSSSPSPGSTHLVNLKDWDDSIYHYDAISFQLQEDGSYQAVRKTTEFVGSATQIAFLDAFGDGNLDVIFNYGPRGPNFIPQPAAEPFGDHYGAYIVRSYGAGNGDNSSDYQPVDYLDKVTDGLGNVSHWRYRPLSSGEQSAGHPFYETEHTYDGDGYLHFASSMYTVQRFEEDDAKADTLIPNMPTKEPCIIRKAEVLLVSEKLSKRTSLEIKLHQAFLAKNSPLLAYLNPKLCLLPAI
ncbi:MAG: VCBS repeat-containing protein [Shewanella fodinae]|nr:VCBS repeat-containing protein [Shewanella fodinae]